MKLCADVLRNSLICPSIVTHHTCQFWARSEPVNMPKTILSPSKCGVRAVIRFLYSESVTKNAVLRYCTSSWQCSAAHCNCNKEAPEAFSMGSVWSPTIICPDFAPCDFHLSPRMKRSKDILAQWAADQFRELAESTAAGFYDEVIGKLVPRYEKCLCRSVKYVEK